MDGQTYKCDINQPRVFNSKRYRVSFTKPISLKFFPFPLVPPYYALARSQFDLSGIHEPIRNEICSILTNRSKFNLSIQRCAPHVTCVSHRNRCILNIYIERFTNKNTSKNAYITTSVTQRFIFQTKITWKLLIKDRVYLFFVSKKCNTVWRDCFDFHTFILIPLQ